LAKAHYYEAAREFTNWSPSAPAADRQYVW
jgi:hypothetical protein